MEGDMPFMCPISKCGKRFTNEDHLNVHSKTHEMSLALNTEKSSSSPAHPFVDQTPTPTKILKNFEEIGLFQEFSKNPFDDAYKKALDSEVAPLPGPSTNELNTPTLIMTDSTRHVATSTSGGANLFPLVDRLKTSGDTKLRPSPLAGQHSPSGKTRNVGRAVSNVVTVTRSKGRELTSQVADSTSTDVTFDLTADPNHENNLQEDDDRLFSGSRPSTTSPHSTTGRLPSDSLDNSHTPMATSSWGGPGHSSTTVTMATGGKVKKEFETDMASQQQQQCTMQVLLQLPNGQTVPISIPATISNPLIVDDTKTPTPQPPSVQDIKPQVTTLVLPPQPAQALPAPPALQPAPSKPGHTPTTTMTLKQRLKAQLQNQVSPTAKSSPLSSLSSSSSSTPSDQVSLSKSTTSAFVPANNNSPQQVTQMFMTQTPTSPIMMMMDSPGSEVNMSDSSDYSFDSKRQKMSPDCEDPEERRRKFLERNRAAAARCRQKRKHWIGNLERKADELQNTNLRLQNDVKLLRGEVAHLKTLLLAHKDCPVTQQQRSSGQLQQVILTDNSAAFSNHELAQVVPTGGAPLTSDPIPVGQTALMSYLSDRSGATQGTAGLIENGKDG